MVVHIQFGGFVCAFVLFSNRTFNSILTIVCEIVHLHRVTLPFGSKRIILLLNNNVVPV